MITKIEVTQEDIDKGVRGTTCLCPVALAIRRSLKVPLACHMNKSIRITKPEYPPEVYKARSPVSVLDFVHGFDNYLEVKPFTFELDIPEELLVAHA
jgi:hypothetical protein